MHESGKRWYALQCNEGEQRVRDAKKQIEARRKDFRQDVNDTADDTKRSLNSTSSTYCSLKCPFLGRAVLLEQGIPSPVRQAIA